MFVVVVEFYNTTFLILELNCASTENSSWHVNKCLLAERMHNTFKHLSCFVTLSDSNCVFYTFFSRTITFYHYSYDEDSLLNLSLKN